MISVSTGLKAAVGLAVVAGLGLVWGCPGPPVDGGCAGENQACTDAADCCEGLTCPDGACVTSTTTCAAEGEICTDADECCEGLVCSGGTCVTPGTGNTAALPAKSIELNLIGIHDPNSDAYNDNCIGCHGDRTDEVALDGVTPVAHATMAGFFGEGNDRCIACHNGGPDFLTLSMSSLRQQVSIVDVGCANCHGANSTPSYYAK